MPQGVKVQVLSRAPKQRSQLLAGVFVLVMGRGSWTITTLTEIKVNTLSSKRRCV